MTKDHQEKQFWDKPSPPFVELQGGLPYDVVWYRGERYLASLRIGSESGLAPLERGQLRITQSDQSGFLIETPNASLLFDWYRSALPPFAGTNRSMSSSATSIRTTSIEVFCVLPITSPRSASIWAMTTLRMG